MLVERKSLFSDTNSNKANFKTQIYENELYDCFHYQLGSGSIFQDNVL